jgi:methionine-gamma-lyase
MTPDRVGLRPEILVVAFGYDPEVGIGAVTLPIHMTSTFVYLSATHARSSKRRS